MEPALAGQFSVTPVRIYMAPRDRATAITITNEGDTELVMQADLYQWRQKAGGEDDLTLSEDLFLSPPIIKLGPRERQVVRLARVKTGAGADQLTYRMMLREIVEARPTEKAELQVALAFSLPVFITPPTAKSKLGCVTERAATDQVKITCQNTGNAYVHPRGFVLSSASGEELASRDSGGYLLPGIKRDFDIKRAGGAIPAGPAKLVATLDDGTKSTFDVMLAK
ncbi:hypothetical protein DSM104440_00680 [Usitatibacter palustris]|uniref:Pili assembly chaperone N-terminal domain-containing protein n=1 Tax=Usitatibacter palustris TaxID=2732487 RepID=A0A6M4H382_9PROT|nr:hypothetical protein DSM104440_00680 [Usitatibacter palustris]